MKTNLSSCSEGLFENPIFTSENYAFSKGYNNWKEAGILKFRDNFQDTENRVLTEDALEIKFDFHTDNMKYNRLSSSVSNAMKKITNFPIIDRFSPISFANKCLTC